MIRLGLTGSIATGKSTIAQMMADAGAIVVDADDIAHRVVQPGEPAYQPIIDHFGPELLLDDGTLNRIALGQIVFNNEEQRQKLNAIVHPLVRQELEAKAAEVAAQETALGKHFLLVMVIPLLFESNLAHMVDLTVVVYCPERLQRARLMERNGWTEAEANARIRSQISIEDKVRKADEVIDNSNSRDEARKHLNIILGGLTWDPYVNIQAKLD